MFSLSCLYQGFIERALPMCQENKIHSVSNSWIAEATLKTFCSQMSRRHEQPWGNG